MASRRDRTVVDATTKLSRTIARALRAWAKEVGADEMAGEVMDRVREGFDGVRDRAAAGGGGTEAVALRCREVHAWRYMGSEATGGGEAVTYFTI